GRAPFAALRRGRAPGTGRQRALPTTIPVDPGQLRTSGRGRRRSAVDAPGPHPLPDRPGHLPAGAESHRRTGIPRFAPAHATTRGTRAACPPLVTLGGGRRLRPTTVLGGGRGLRRGTRSRVDRRGTSPRPTSPCRPLRTHGVSERGAVRGPGAGGAARFP